MGLFSKNDTVKSGDDVKTRAGQVSGVVVSASRHPVTREITSVVVDPGGKGDEDKYIVTSLRNLRSRNKD